MFYRVEVEFLSGPDNTRDRRTFEKASLVEFVQDQHLRVVSEDGDMVVKFDRLQWYHSQPMHELYSDIEQSTLAVMRDSNGKLTQIIHAIKHYRGLTNQGLKESKEYCDNLRRKHGYVPEQPF